MSSIGMGRLRFELRTSRLKAGCSTAELATRPLGHAISQSAGLDGVVCYAQEVGSLRAQCGDKFTLVTPGIRLPDDDAGDQRRVVTPWDAVAGGSNYLVVGRSITAAINPTDVIDSIISRLTRA